MRRPATFASLIGSKSGQALIIVLGFVSLMTVLTLIFLTSVLTQRTNSKAVASGVSARQLAQSAVQLVEGIITKATVPSYDTTIAWACQPGMIRTYGTPGAAGSAGTPSSAPLAYYKLYSSNNMVINSSSTLPVSSYTVDADVSKGGDLLSNWNALTALYTDLNAPVGASDGSLVFPIVDPRAGPGGTYPVQGFSYLPNTASNSINTINGVSGTGGTGSYLPMPVQWIYVLRDGTLASPQEPNSDPAPATNVASFAGPNAPTADNPIVGRIAFWTDDETGKVNLNTASEGTYWDTPMSDSGGAGGGTNPTDTFSYTSSGAQTGQTAALGDLIFTNYIPASHEYQRYPGHPATTCLSEVFGSALTSLSPFSRSNVVLTIDGAVPLTTDVSGAINSTEGGTTSATGILPMKFDRLYASVDDFNFTPPRALQSLGSATTTQQIIEQSRFFLTTSSKAPDLNPFGLPKITIWPMWDDTYAANRSTLDGTILHCSTVANGAAAGSQHRMIFTRENSTSPTVDWNISDSTQNSEQRNQQLYQYLQTLTNQPIPGFGGTFTTKYTAAERDQILTEIFDYIRCTNLADQTGGASYTPTAAASATTLNVRNGSAGSAAVNYGGQGEVVPIQITQGTTTQGMGRIATIAELTLVLDKCDDRNSTSAAETSTNLAPYVTVTDSDNSGGVQWCPASGSGTPTTLPSLTGPPAQPANTYSPTGAGGAPAAQTCVEWAVFPKLFCPMAGYPGLANNLRIHYSNFQLQINGWSIKTVQSGGFTTANPVFDQYDMGRLGTAGTESTIGGFIGPQMLMGEGATGTYAGAPKDSFMPTGIVVVPGQSQPAVAAAAAGTMTISGSFTVQIYSPGSTTGLAGSIPPGTAPAGTLIQTLTFTIGTPSNPLTVPIPGLAGVGTFRSLSGYTAPPGTGATPTTGTFIYPAAYNTLTSAAATNSKRIQPQSSSGPPFINGTQTVNLITFGTDVSRSVVPTGMLNGVSLAGDTRLIALSGASTAVPAAAFATDMIPGATAGSAPTAPTGTTFNCNGERTGVQDPQAGMGQTSLCLPELWSHYTGGKRDPDIGVYQIFGNSNIPLMTNSNDNNVPADWDNGPGLVPDGAFFNKVDEGTAGSNPNDGSPAPYIPYMYALSQLLAEGLESTQFFSPNQQLSSPVMFGSLLAGTDHPWRTLLFRPATLPGYQVASSTTSYTHPGGANPPDHLLLDFFRMPVVEPYAISQPLATAGKINLNTQIAPFTYITRTTGLRAVLKSVMMTAFNPLDPAYAGSSSSFIETQKSGYYYKGTGMFANVGTPAINTFTTRYPIDLTNTINLLYAGNTGDPFALDSTNTNGYDAFPEFNRTTHTLAAPNFFVSPSQICDLPLIPLGSSINVHNAITGIGSSITSLTGAAGLGAFWNANSMTGDNSLERPYSLIYPRVTTQSNTFTVHVRAQSLQKVNSNVEAPTTWTEGTDQVIGEYRGSFTIEKYFDPTNATITDSFGTVQTDANDSSLPATAAIRGALWRLLSDKRLGQ